MKKLVTIFLSSFLGVLLILGSSFIMAAIINVVSVNTVSAAITFSKKAGFKSDYPCTNVERRCIESGVREIDGNEVHRDCWQWEYVKRCAYPSLDNCKKYAHCSLVRERDCLLRDSQGACVNKQYEFACLKDLSFEDIQKRARKEIEDFNPGTSRVCVGTPCMDGDCFDQSYDTNGAMMSSLSMLHAAKNMKPDSENNFNLFKGSHRQCSKKMVGFSLCCNSENQGWGNMLGAKCSSDDNLLIQKRRKGHCHHIGKYDVKKLNVRVLTKHVWCCFGSVLDKVIQEQGRKQIGKGWGSPKNPDCSGFSMEEIQRIDFTKIDFSEFIQELKANTFAPGDNKMPSSGDIQARMQRAGKKDFDVRKYDPNKSNKENNRSGWNDKANHEGQ